MNKLIDKSQKLITTSLAETKGFLDNENHMLMRRDSLIIDNQLTIMMSLKVILQEQKPDKKHDDLETLCEMLMKYSVMEEGHVEYLNEKILPFAENVLKEK